MADKISRANFAQVAKRMVEKFESTMEDEYPTLDEMELDDWANQLLAFVEDADLEGIAVEEGFIEADE